MAFMTGRVHGLFRWAQFNHNESLKQRTFSRGRLRDAVEDAEKQDSRRMGHSECERAWTHSSWLWDVGAKVHSPTGGLLEIMESMGRNASSLKKAKTGPYLTSSKETETSVLELQGTKFCWQPKWVWQQILSQSLLKECNLADILILAPGDHIQNDEMINGCCFKPLDLW